MAGTSIGSIYARIGADTSDFQAKLAQSNSALGSWAGGIGGATGLVETHFVTMGRSASTVFNAMGLGGTQVEFALSRILQNVGMIEVALPVALAAMAPQIAKFVNNLGFMKDAFQTQEAPVRALGEALMEDAGRYGDTADQLKHLMDQLGIAHPVWLDSGKMTQENAELMVTWMNNLQDGTLHLKDHTAILNQNTAAQIVANEKTAVTAQLEKDRNDAMVTAAANQLRFNDAWGKMVPVAAQVAIAMAAGNKSMQDLGDATLKAYGIISQTSAAASLDDIEKKLRAVSLAGGDAGQVMEKMGPDILKAITDAKEMGVAIPPMMEDVALAITEKNKLWVGDLMTDLKKTPDAARDAANASAKYLDDMGNKLEGSISGGFGRGIDEGASYGKQQIDAFIRDIEGRPIKLTFDVSELDKAIMDALSGRSRGVPGMAPS